MKREELTITLTAAFGIAGMFQAALPSIYDARQMPEDSDFRATQVSLLIFAASLALALSLATQSTLPALGILGMAGGQLIYWEWAIRA